MSYSQHYLIETNLTISAEYHAIKAFTIQVQNFARENVPTPPSFCILPMQNMFQKPTLYTKQKKVLLKILVMGMC